MKKAAVSVVVIAKNEEKRLAECLKSAAFAAEIVVLDDLSTDRTQFDARAGQNALSPSTKLRCKSPLSPRGVSCTDNRSDRPHDRVSKSQPFI